MHKSYIDWAFTSSRPWPDCAVLEAYRGSDIVVWHGTIERQLIDLERRYRQDKNDEDADKVHQFLHTWRNNRITGSVNRDTLLILEAAAAQLAVETWKSAVYFGALRDQLRRLLASEEELPRMPSASDERRGMGGVRRSTSPEAPPQQFGAEKTATPPGGAPGVEEP